MAIVKPFRGIHFLPGKVADLARVLAPPFDPLHKDAQRASAASGPRNAANLLYPDPQLSGESVSLSSLLHEGILRQSDAPAIYPYEVEYSTGRKKCSLRGFFASTPVTPLGQDGVFALQAPAVAAARVEGPQPHELPGDAIEPMTFLHDGADPDLAELLAGAGAPLLETLDAEGATHRLWELTDPEKIQAVSRRMERARLLLAAGEHVHERSLHAGAAAGPSPERFALFASLDAAGQGLQPVHRLIHVPDDFDFNHFFERLGASFDVYPLYGADAIQGLLDKAVPGEVRIVTFIAKPRRCLLMVPKSSLPEFAPGRSPAWRALDAAVLHGAVLSGVLGITAEQQCDPEILCYMRGVTPAVENLQKGGRYRIAFMLNPPKVPQIQELALAGEPLPPMAVDIRPHVPVGLLFGRSA